MAADSKQAVSDLHDALTAFRKACGDDPDCKAILVGVDTTERELEKQFPAEEKREKPGDPDEQETPREDQPKTLKGATLDVRARFAKARD